MEVLHSSRGSSSSFNRSNELLSCAKTSWKIRQQEELREHQQQQRDLGNAVPPPPPPRNTPNFRLASLDGPSPPSLAVLEDGFTLLRAMEYGTKQLQGLVRRRGHTNDPTQEISSLVKQLEQDLKELTSYCEQLLKVRRRKQEQRHWELVVQWFQQVANHHSGQLQECLKMRGQILAEQAQKRRKLVENNRNKANGSNKGARVGATSAAASVSASATPLFDSPLFAATPSKRNGAMPMNRGNRNPNNGQQQELQQPLNRRKPQHPAPPNGSASNYYYNGATPGGDSRPGYGAAYGGNSSGGYSGYGGGYGGSGGMRQRRGGNPSSTTIPVQEQEEEEKVHSQIQMRERKRQTQQRLDEARQAESTLSEVAKLYSKMSSLITQQGETLEKIEDDVECALVDVTAGQEELTKLYAIKKGNRPLIIKTFLILNFLIVFMRGYRNR